MLFRNYFGRSLGAAAGLLLAAAAAAQPSVHTVAGSGLPGRLDGPAAQARFYDPYGVAVDAQGRVYVADSQNHDIRRLDPGGQVVTIGGIGAATYNDAPLGPLAGFALPHALVVDAAGVVYVADTGNDCIRRLDPAGPVSTLAGTNTSGYADGPGPQARFYSPTGIALDGSGGLYVADGGNNRIRRVSAAGMVSTVAGSGATGFLDGPGPTARFNEPHGVAVDAQGTLYVADRGNHRVRRISPTGQVSTLAGAGTRGYQDGPAGAARFDSPTGVAVDAQGVVYVAEREGCRIRRIDPSGQVGTLAGTGVAGFADGPAATAQLNRAYQLAWGPSGLYIADSGNNRIRRLGNLLPTRAGVIILYGEIYPNPAGAEATARLELSRAAKLAVRVCDLAGRTVFSGIHPATTGTNLVRLPVAAWPVGVYVVSLTTGAGTLTQRLLVQR